MCIAFQYAAAPRALSVPSAGRPFEARCALTALTIWEARSARGAPQDRSVTQSPTAAAPACGTKAAEAALTSAATATAATAARVTRGTADPAGRRTVRMCGLRSVIGRRDAPWGGRVAYDVGGGVPPLDSLVRSRAPSSWQRGCAS